MATRFGTPVLWAAVLAGSALSSLAGCGTSSSGTTFSPDAATDGPPKTSRRDASSGMKLPSSDAGAPPKDSGSTVDAFTLPPNFVPTELGGYALGAPIQSGSDAGLVENGAGSNCSLVVGVVRDFRSYGIQDGGQPDFEHFSGSGATLGLVSTTLGADQKPVYAGECDDTGAPNPPCLFGQQMTTKANFDEWYRYTPGVNDPYLVYIEFVPNNGVYTFKSSAFFPLDNAGFGNTPGYDHNYSFTTEVHLKFAYSGGETFSFTGDDDLWIFIDGKLAIDLGGLHTPVSGTVSLDTLGLTKGHNYNLDLFNAERHTVGSDFRADTNLAFVNCGTVVPDQPPK